MYDIANEEAAMDESLEQKEWFSANTVQDIVSDEELNELWSQCDFGPNVNAREKIKEALLKSATVYYNGSTSNWLLRQLGLIGNDLNITVKGGCYLHLEFDPESNLSKEHLLVSLKEEKEKHELPNENNGDYNIGYVAAINKVINLISKK